MVRTPARCHKVVRLIPVRNIYWMLAYAFRALEKGAYERLGSEEFGNAQELCAAILARGVESQVKRGLAAAMCRRPRRFRTCAARSMSRRR